MNENLENVETTAPDVPYIVHEAEVARQERHIKRLWVIIILLICLLVATNAGWMIYEAQFEDVVVTQDVSQTTDQGGNNENTLYTGDYNGYAEGETNNQNPQT